MCCAGTIYSVIPLREGEADKARAAGMAVSLDDEGQHCAALPCPHLDGTACRIYGDWRPSTCGDYFCKLQVGLRDGEVSLDEAMAEVGRLKEMIAARLPETANRTLRELVIEAAELTRGGDIDADKARLIVQVGVVNREIDRVIRYPHQGTFQGQAH